MYIVDTTLAWGESGAETGFAYLLRLRGIGFAARDFPEERKSYSVLHTTMLSSGLSMGTLGGKRSTYGSYPAYQLKRRKEKGMEREGLVHYEG